jgi:V/A-type H+-transporting ATPase subunit K
MKQLMTWLKFLVLPLLVMVLLSVPFIAAYVKKKGYKNAGTAMLVHFGSFAAVMLAAVILPVGDILTFAAENGGAAITSTGAGLAYLGAGFCTAIAALSSGIAVGGAAPAAIGATAEDPKNFSKSLLFVALGEGIAIYGVLISFMIINSVS